MNKLGKKPVLLILISCLFNINLISQLNNDFLSPLEIPLLLSGNFCELRSGHFHAGIDIKTKGVIGEPVYAIYDGFVSRIKVSSYGYGKAIYMQHSNGYTSVFAHLNAYNDSIATIVKNIQYKEHSYGIDKYFKQGEIPIKKGDLIGYTGNTGSSGGPHLHFELRRTDGQVPQNVLKYNFPVQDTIAPKFLNLFLYQFNNPDELKVVKKELVGVYNTTENKYKVFREIVSNSPYFALGIESYDYLNGSGNKCGIYNASLFQDGENVYEFRLDEMPFGVTRYIHSHMDYAEKVGRKRNVHKLFVEPNNQLKIYEENKRGILSFGDTNKTAIEIVVKDVYGNTASLEFEVEKGDGDFMDHNFEPGRDFRWNESNHISDDKFQFDLPQGALYSNTFMTYVRLPATDSTILSYKYKVGNNLIPLHKFANIGISPRVHVSKDFQEKLLLAVIDEENNLSAIQSEYVDGIVKGRTRELGAYVVMVDTISPSIRPIRFKTKATYLDGAKISFFISDDLSGIKDINGYVDSKWCLFEYDAKNNKIAYAIDGEKLEKGKLHNLQIYVVDAKSNIGVFQGEFYY